RVVLTAKRISLFKCDLLCRVFTTVLTTHDRRATSGRAEPGLGSKFFKERRESTCSYIKSLFSPSCVRALREIAHKLEERGRLPDEQSICRKTRQSRRCGPSCFGWTNDRACWQRSAEEGNWLRHDEVGLKILSAKGGRIQIRKRHFHARHWIDDS